MIWEVCTVLTLGNSWDLSLATCISTGICQTSLHDYMLTLQTACVEKKKKSEKEESERKVIHKAPVEYPITGQRQARLN